MEGLNPLNLLFWVRQCHGPYTLCTNRKTVTVIVLSFLLSPLTFSFVATHSIHFSLCSFSLVQEIVSSHAFSLSL